MKIIQIADRGSIWHPFPRPAFMMRQIPSGLSLEGFIRLHQTDWDKGDVFVIDVHFTWNGSTLAALDGIRFLKILRLLGFKQHCVLYSFLPLNYLLTAYPHNEILLSKGTTFIQLPDEVDMDLCLRVVHQPCEENIYPFFSAEATELLSMRRHSLANWWGLLRVYDVLKAGGFVGDDLPEGLRKAIAKDGSYSGMLMNFARFRDTPPRCALSDEMTGVISKYLKALWNKELRVVYVDDQAKEGWAYLLQIILYGRERRDLFIAPEVSGPGLDLDGITGMIVDSDPDLVILDIRLEEKDEKAKVSNLSGIVLINKLVDQLLNTCPILVFTASDKRNVSETALTAGADGIWTKEGLDEGAQFEPDKYYDFSISRFLGLLEQLHRLTGAEFSLLYDCLRQIVSIEESDVLFWWQKRNWYPGDDEERIPVDKGFLIQELIRLFRAHKQLLQATLPAVRRSSYDMLSIKLCRLLEVLHPSVVDDDGKFITLGKVTSGIWPVGSVASAYVYNLVKVRNSIVHADSYFGVVPVDMHRYEKALETFFAYLTLKSPAAELGRLSGTLRRNESKTGRVFYNLGDGVFSDKADQTACEVLLNGNDVLANVEGRILGPIHLFNLKTVSKEVLPGGGQKYNWTAEFRIVGTNPQGILLSLNNILPRENTRITLIADDIETIEYGVRLFFHIKWTDTGDKSKCAIYDTTLDPPEVSRHTFWSATVSSINRGEGYLRLEDINPPLNAIFKVDHNAFAVLKQALGKDRICFLPGSWFSTWELTSVALKQRKRVYIDMPVVRAGISAGAINAIRKIAGRHDLFILSTRLEDIDAQLFNDRFQGHLVLSTGRESYTGDVLISGLDKSTPGGFTGSRIQLGSESYPDWDSVLDYLDVQ